VSDQTIQIAYLAVVVLFIMGLKGLTHPKTAVRGNLMGALAMLLAVIVTLTDQNIASYTWILAGLVVGSGIGAVMALKVQMTQMPQLVALFNGFGGIASFLVAGAYLLTEPRSSVESATMLATALSGLMVADPETMEPVPADGETMGEIFMQGNVVMKGYLKNPDATDGAFKGGWFASGDLGVMHPDGYIALKDRSKDIIISGGENISSVEVEGILYKHPAVMEAAVVARPDEKWGETPCAFVELKPDATATEAELIAFCRDNMAHFKAPKTVVFGTLPKTSTGKVQKFVLRDQARALG